MLSILENFLLVVWAITVFSLPVILILPIVFASDSYD